MASAPPDYVQLGQLGRAFQLAGGVRFYPLGEAEAEAIQQLSQVFVPALGERRLRRVRLVSGHTILYLQGITTREAAKALANEPLFAAEHDLPTAAPNASYHDALLGLPVMLAGQQIAEVMDQLDAGGQALLLIDYHGEEKFLPLAADYVRVDADKIELIDPPEGLLEL